MITINALNKDFPGPKPKKGAVVEQDARHRGKIFRAVWDVSFTVNGDRILGLLGPNGAGKTTLLRMLSTALKPTSGSARIDELDIVKEALDVRKRIGFLSGNTGLYGRLTAREMVAYFGRLHGMSRPLLLKRSEEIFELLHMNAFVDKRNDSLSSGMKQKVSIARTLIHDPDVLIFDEPTTGLDVEAANTIIEFIQSCKQNGKTVLFSTHNMHEVDRLCDDVVILNKARICFKGSVSDMRKESGKEKLDQAFLALISKEVRHDQ